MKNQLLKGLREDLHKLRLAAVIASLLIAMGCGNNANPCAPTRIAHHGVCTQRQIIDHVNGCGQQP